MSSKPSENTMICGLFKPVQLLAQTPTGQVWSVIDDEGHTYAAKVTKMNDRGAVLAEYRVYAQLTKGQIKYGHKSNGITPHGFLNIHFMGAHGNECDVIVTELQSLDLSSLRNEEIWNVKFTRNSYLLLGRDMLFVVMTLHQQGFIHRNVNPHSFRIAQGLHPYLADFSLAERYIDLTTYSHYPERYEQSFKGTLKYASLNAHLLKSQSRRDDMMSLGYTIIDMVRGRLPWEESECMLEVKQRTSIEELCEGFPEGVLKYMHIVNTMAFDATPDYFLLYTLLEPKA